MTEYNGMKVGDLITAYRAGIWRIDSFTRRFYDRSHLDMYYKRYYDSLTDTYNVHGKITKVGDEYTPLVNHTLICDSKGKLANSKKPKTSQCDAAYCQPASIYLEELEQQLAAIKSIINQK